MLLEGPARAIDGRNGYKGQKGGGCPFPGGAPAQDSARVRPAAAALSRPAPRHDARLPPEEPEGEKDRGAVVLLMDGAQTLPAPGFDLLHTPANHRRLETMESGGALLEPCAVKSRTHGSEGRRSPRGGLVTRLKGGKGRKGSERMR